MKNTGRWVGLSLTGVTALVLGGLLLSVINGNYLTIKSPYIGYELGYQEANIGHEALLSQTMKDRSVAKLRSELMENREKYEYNEDTQIASTIPLGYLYMGRYDVEASLGDQKDDILVNVHDSYSPQFLNLYTTITAEANAMKKHEELIQYFNIKDYDTDATFGLNTEGISLKKTGEYTIKAIGYDTSGNFTEETVTLKLISSKEAQLRPEILTPNRKGEIPVTPATRKKVGDKYLTFDTGYLHFGDDLKDGHIIKNSEEYNKLVQDLTSKQEEKRKEESKYIDEAFKDREDKYDSTDEDKAKEDINNQREQEKNEDRNGVDSALDQHKQQIEDMRNQEKEDLKKKEEGIQDDLAQVEEQITNINNGIDSREKELERLRQQEEEARRRAEEARRREEEAKKKADAEALAKAQAEKAKAEAEAKKKKEEEDAAKEALAKKKAEEEKLEEQKKKLQEALDQAKKEAEAEAKAQRAREEVQKQNTKKEIDSAKSQINAGTTKITEIKETIKKDKKSENANRPIGYSLNDDLAKYDYNTKSLSGNAINIIKRQTTVRMQNERKEQGEKEKWNDNLKAKSEAFNKVIEDQKTAVEGYENQLKEKEEALAEVGETDEDKAKQIKSEINNIIEKINLANTAYSIELKSKTDDYDTYKAKVDKSIEGIRSKTASVQEEKEKFAIELQRVYEKEFNTEMVRNEKSKYWNTEEINHSLYRTNARIPADPVPVNPDSTTPTEIANGLTGSSWMGQRIMYDHLQNAKYREVPDKYNKEYTGTVQWEDSKYRNMKASEGYVTIGEIFGNASSKITHISVYGDVKNKTLLTSGSTGEFKSFKTLEEAQIARQVLEDKANMFAFQFKDKCGCENLKKGIISECIIRYLEKDDTDKGGKLTNENIQSVRNMENSDLIKNEPCGQDIYEKEKRDDRTIKKDKTGYYYNPAVMGNASSYEGGWYVKLQGFHVTHRCNPLADKCKYLDRAS